MRFTGSAQGDDPGDGDSQDTGRMVSRMEYAAITHTLMVKANQHFTAHGKFTISGDHASF